MREYAVIRGPIREGEIAHEAIREELSRIPESPVFASSDRSGRFLRNTVEMTLAGDAETVKEYLIGTEVYERIGILAVPSGTTSSTPVSKPQRSEAFQRPWVIQTLGVHDELSAKFRCPG
jgi:hypothetical protein